MGIIKNKQTKINKEEIEKNATPKKAVIYAFIILCILFSLLYYQFLNYQIEQSIPYDGYAISGKKISDNLVNKNYEPKNDDIKIVKIKEEDLLYKRLNDYYVGEERKQKININYPIYINDELALYNLSQDVVLITKEFGKIEGYPRFTITGGSLYNSINLEKVDTNQYIFIKNDDNIYTNLNEITIETKYNKYEIKINSLMYYSKEYVAYYEMQNEQPIYRRIEDIDEESKIIIGELKFTYKQLLRNLEIIEEEKTVEVKDQEEVILEEKEKEKPEIINKEDKNETEESKKPEEVTKPEEQETEKEKPQEEKPKEENPEEEPKDPEEEKPQEEIYVKPNIIISEFSTQVYSTQTNIQISDPARKIVSAINFIVKKDGKTYLRKSVVNSGNMQIVGLMPNSKYTIEANYIFLDEEGKRIQKNFVFDNIQTKGIDILEPIEVSFENGEIFSRKIQIKNLQITSNLGSEALKGVNRVEIVVKNSNNKLNTKTTSDLLKGQKVDFETKETLSSNSQIEYEIKIYDIQGSELKVNNSKGETRTAKQEPKVSVKVEKQDISLVELKLDLKNDDNVEINNYRYEVLNTAGEIVLRDDIKKNQNQIALTSLDPNQYFTINIYADYDIEDGKGTLESIKIGNANFTSVPLSILGYLNMQTEIKEIKQDNITINFKINLDRTDSRLVNILQNITVEIYEKQSEELITSKLLENETIINLKNGEEIELNVDKLQSNTEYKIKLYGMIKQGNVEQDVDGLLSFNSFITLKKEAEVLIKNQFVTDETIDFDVKIDDIDKAILDDKVRMEIRTQDEQLVRMENIQTNQEFLRLTYDKLSTKVTYIIRFFAAEYNVGNDPSTYKSEYLIKKINIYTEPGISGQINLTDLIREENGKNLLDAKSEVKWYSASFNTWAYWDKTYNERTQELSLYAGKSGNGQYYTYNLTKYIGQTVTISFSAKLDKNSSNMKVYMQNSKNGANRTLINGLTENEWKEYKYTYTVDRTGYLGFYLVAGNTTDEYKLLLKELQIELGSRKTSYEPYKYDVKSQIEVNLKDLRGEIVSKDYYIGIYKDGKQIALENYKEIDENNQVDKIVKQYELEENKTYKFDLQVKIRDRFYIISSTEFNTNGEILGIRDETEFVQMQPNGNYIILKDMDLSGKGSAARMGCDKFGLRGRIDFQGHKLRTNSTNRSGIFYLIENSGIVENLVYELALDNKTEISYMYGFVTYNRGTIKNCMVNLVECTKVPNVIIGVFGYANYGTFENFVVNFQTPLYGARHLAGTFLYSYGTIKNGYLYGEPINASFTIGEGQYRDIGALVYGLQKGTVQNVYSLINVNVLEQEGITQNISNLVEVNAQGLVENVYSVGSGGILNFNMGPTVGRNSSGKNNNVYYFADEIYTNTYNQKTTKLALYDETFQNNLLNGENQFFVGELIKQKYFPQVKLSDKMPNQKYIELPKVQDEDLVDAISLKVLSQENNVLKVELNVHNPSGERITNISVSNLITSIVSQTYSEGKTALVLELKNPTKYVSKYDIRSITSQGAFNIPFTRSYEEGERSLNVDFYKEIHTVAQWKEINSSLTENYRLMADLDFINEAGNIRINNTYSGKIDGNNHTIKNIFIPDTGYGLFNTLNGEIKNLNIENYRQNSKNTANVAVISTANYNTIIDNVHVNGVDLSTTYTGSSYVAGLIARATNVTIRNSSVKNAKISINGNSVTVAVGGMVAYGSNMKIQNSFVQDIDFDIAGILQYQGIGGIVGRDTDTGGMINYCYATGNINTDAEIVGGLYGYTASYNVKHNYSLVNIQSQNDYIGGVGGYDNNSEAKSTAFNLSIGNVYSDKTSQYIGRVIGSNQTEDFNYAYSGQLINGFTSNEYIGATLLTAEELMNEKTYIEILQFGNSFNYEQLKEGILPKIYNTDGTNLVANQEDQKIEVRELIIEEIEAQKQDMTTVIARIVIDNPSQVNIQKIIIKDMEVTVTNNVNQAGKTYIDLRAKPTKAYDSYQVTQIIYSGGNEVQEVKQEAKINVQFYNEIYNFEDWQEIDTTSAQNYRLMADIDFAGKNNPKINVSIGRLEAEGNGYTLKNLDITLNGTIQGMIKEVKNSLRNITFENINITNTGSGNYTGLIVRNIGDIENVKFKNISVTATKMSYVGMIANNSAFNIKGVDLSDVQVYGTSYVSAFIARTDSGIYKNINADNITVEGTGDRIAGIIASISERNIFNLQNFNVTNSNITGRDFVGGILGNGRYASVFTVENVNITGRNYVGGISAQLTYAGADNINFNTKNSYILGTGNYIGGVFGVCNEIWNAFIIDSEVYGQGVNCLYVGGIAGQHQGNGLYNSGAIRTTIKSEGKNIGGLAGYQSSTTVAYSFVEDCTVQGDSNVGGIVGQHRNGTIRYSYSNANVIATFGSAGGVIGYLNNTSMTAASYTTYLDYMYVAGSHITAITRAGGLIGQIKEELYVVDDIDFLKRNYVEAYVECDTNMSSMGIGSNSIENSKIDRFYIYEGSTINGTKVSINNDNIIPTQLLNLENLKTQTTYTSKLGWSTSYFDFTTLQEGKYPKVKNGNTITLNQKGIDLPTGEATMNVALARQKAMLLNRDEETKKIQLPDIIVYPVAANKINIEFSNIEGDVYFTYNGQSSILLEKNVYTFDYDFKSAINLKIENQYDLIEKVIEPQEISSKISIQDEQYYYLEQGKLKLNGETQSENTFVNLYKQEALGEDGKIYNIITKVTSEEQTQGLQLLEDTVAIETKEYKNNIIDTYAKYSQIKQKEELLQRQAQLWVRNGILSMIDNSVQKVANGQIIDNYNGKEYQTVLGTDNKLYDLKTTIHYPENFKNENIVQIEVNNENEQSMVMVYYNIGRVIVFNYRTGEIIFDNEMKEQIELMDYIKNQISSILIQDNIIEANQEDYKKSQELIEKLQQTPIAEALEKINPNKQIDNEIEASKGNKTTNNIINSNTVTTNNITNSTNSQNDISISEKEPIQQNNNQYIVVYNDNKKDYVVYEESKILDIEEEEIVSETQIINGNQELTNFYQTAENTTKIYAINGFILVIGTITTVLVILYILRKRNKK